MAPPKLDWWRGFRSKELTDLIEEAQTANFDIAIAVARILQADAQARSRARRCCPRRSELERHAHAGVAGERRHRRQVRTAPPTRAALNASYEIDFWGKNRAISEAAQESAIAARFDRDVVAVSTMVSVATAYFLVLSSQDRMRIARQNIAAATACSR